MACQFAGDKMLAESDQILQRIVDEWQTYVKGTCGMLGGDGESSESMFERFV